MFKKNKMSWICLRLLSPFPEQKRGGNILSNHSLDVCQAGDVLFLLPATLIKSFNNLIRNI